VADGLTLGVAATAFAFGLRHGADWDHIAAISDLSGATAGRRRAMWLSTLYIVGHAIVVFALGAAAVLLAAYIPAGLDTAMGRVVGATLVVLGAYVLISLLRNGRSFRMRSRWMLVGDGVRRLLRGHRPPEPVVVEHDHEHPVEEPHALELVTAGAGAPALPAASTHRHPHRHAAAMPDDPFRSYSSPAAFGIGMLHGVGAETPTQVLVLVTAAGAASDAAGLLILGCFIAGLMLSNTAVALATSMGFLQASRNFVAYAVVSVLVAAGSLVLGALYLLGRGDAIPALLGG